MNSRWESIAIVTHQRDGDEKRTMVIFDMIAKAGMGGKNMSFSSSACQSTLVREEIRLQVVDALSR